MAERINGFLQSINLPSKSRFSPVVFSLESTCGYWRALWREVAARACENREKGRVGGSEGEGVCEEEEGEWGEPCPGQLHARMAMVSALLLFLDVS